MFRKTPVSGDRSGLGLFLKAHSVPKNKFDQQFGCVFNLIFNSSKHCKEIFAGVLNAVSKSKQFTSLLFHFCFQPVCDS